jgi:hypothetical protein
MSLQDFVKYLTKEFVQYVNTPKEERVSKQQPPKVSWDQQWFGLLPLAISMFLKRKK